MVLINLLKFRDGAYQTFGNKQKRSIAVHNTPLFDQIHLMAFVLTSSYFQIDWATCFCAIFESKPWSPISRKKVLFLYFRDAEIHGAC